MLAVFHFVELLDDGGVEGQFKETILSLREDQMRKFFLAVIYFEAHCCKDYVLNDQTQCFSLPVDGIQMLAIAPLPRASSLFSFAITLQRN